MRNLNNKWTNFLTLVATHLNKNKTIFSGFQKVYYQSNWLSLLMTQRVNHLLIHSNPLGNSFHGLTLDFLQLVKIKLISKITNKGYYNVKKFNIQLVVHVKYMLIIITILVSYIITLINSRIILFERQLINMLPWVASSFHKQQMPW